ncbi:MAG: tetratricopeptide repeat protein [bacterium]
MSKLKHVYCYLIIIAVTYLTFHNTLSNEFVFDDESVIVNNQSIQSLSDIPRYFTAAEGFHKVIGRYYRPVVSSTYAIDYAIWGLNPYGFHLTNVIIHIICCLLLFKIFAVLFWRYKYRNLFSLLATLIFAVHPIHTEAVSWVSGRTDSLVTMFFFGSFLYYLEFTREMEYHREHNSLHRITSKNYLYLFVSLLFYAAGLLTKEMIVTMPVIIFLYDFVYRKKKYKYFKDNLLNYILFAAVTVLYLLVRYFLLKDIPERESYLYFIGKHFVVVLATMLKTIPVYFRLLIAPFSLLYHYNGVIQDAKSILDAEVLLSILFIFVLIAFSFYYYKRDSIISFCILFFLVSLLPVMNIIPTMNLMAERFLYFTSFSLALLICHLSMIGSSKRDLTFLAFGMGLIVCSLAYLTYVRNNEWKDNNTLYMSAKGVEGTVTLVNEGNIYANNKKYDEAMNLYKRAIELRDNNVLAHHNLGLIYLIRGKLDSAEMKFKKGISVDSLAPDGYFQLATLYNMQGKNDSAIIMLEKLQTVTPNYKESQAILDNLKARGSKDGNISPEGFTDDQTKNYQISALQKSSYKLFTEKKYMEAITDLQKLIALNSDLSAISGFLNNIAMCYEEMNMPELEEKYFLEALKKDNGNLNAMSGLSAFYIKNGNTEKAKEYLNKILKINPEDAAAGRKLDSLNTK